MAEQSKDNQPDPKTDKEKDKDALAAEQLDTVAGGVKTISWSGSDGDEASKSISWGGGVGDA